MKRYPFGMPAWLYWVLVVVAAAVVSAIFQGPPVGTILGLVVVAGGFVWFFAFVKAERDRRYSTYAPVPVVGSVSLGLDRLDVVGESHHVVSIARAVDAGGRDLDAAVSWEPKNPHSESRAALRVELIAGGGRFMCGYVPERYAVDLLPAVKANAEAGRASTLPAAVFGGTADKPNYGVILGSGVRNERY